MASIGISLRPGDARDAGVVEQVMAAAFDPQWGEAWTRSQLLGVMALPGIKLLIAEAGEEPAGFALTRSVLDEAELLLLGVAPGIAATASAASWSRRSSPIAPRIT